MVEVKEISKNITLIFILLQFWNCSDDDTISPSVSIVSPISDEIISDTVRIIVESSDNDAIDRIEFFINDILSFTDFEDPFEYYWNTLTETDLSVNTLKVISYDVTGNYTISDTINLIVDNRVHLWGKYYVIDTTTVLDVSGGEITGFIPSEIGKLVNLRSLDLRSNQLTGEIPEGIFNLTSLEKLYLNDNYLIGNILDEIVHLSSLKELYVQQNQFSGSIPTNISNLQSLIEFSIQENQFSGTISESICQLNEDVFFNIIGSTNFSGNSFCPPYPDCILDFIGGQDTTNCD